MTFYSMERGWMDDRLWKNDVYSKREAWCWLIENAAYQDDKTFVNGKPETIKRGDIIQTHRQLAEAWKWGRQKVRTFLDHLKLDQKLTISVTQGITTISLINYDTYQNQQPRNNPVNNQEITKEQPRSNPLKKEINNKTIKKTKAKKEKVKILCPPDWGPSDETYKWATQHGLSNNQVNIEIDNFIFYFTEGNGEGTKRPGWNASFKTWIRKNNNYSHEIIDAKSELENEYDHKIKYWLKNEDWPMQWGTEPDKPGHKVPYSIMIAHGLKDPNENLH